MPKKQKLEIATEKVNLADIKEADINPQTMGKKDFSRLVKSVKRDGTLTSAILLNRKDGKLVCISGHHRIKAALKAGLSEATAMIVDNMDESTAIRLQLQHNDIHGEPDKELESLLKIKMDEYDLELVAPGDITMPEMETINIDVKNIKITMTVTPETAEQFAELIIEGKMEEGDKYLLTPKEYLAMKKYLTMAYESGYKVTGRAIEKLCKIVNAHKHELKDV